MANTRAARRLRAEREADRGIRGRVANVVADWYCFSPMGVIGRQQCEGARYKRIANWGGGWGDNSGLSFLAGMLAGYSKRKTR